MLFMSLLLLVATALFAQDAPKDAPKDERSALSGFAKFPVNIRLAQEIVTAGGYTMEDDGAQLADGDRSEALRTTLNISMPVYKGKASYVNFGGFYNFHNVQFSPPKSGDAYEIDMGRENDTWGLQGIYMYGGKLWNRKFTGLANLRGEFSESGLERVTMFAVGMLQLKRTERSSLGVGAVLLLNTSSPWPLFPFVTYRCKFSEKWSLDLMLPQLYVNNHLSAKDKLSAGFSISGEHFYISPGRADLPATCMYSRSNLRPEIVYEHRMTPLTKLFLKGGSTICINSRLYSSSGNSRYMDISQKPSFFMQVGVSYGIMGM